jgi:RecG-like helicase
VFRIRSLIKWCNIVLETQNLFAETLLFDYRTKGWFLKETFVQHSFSKSWYVSEKPNLEFRRIVLYTIAINHKNLIQKHKIKVTRLLRLENISMILSKSFAFELTNAQRVIKEIRNDMVCAQMNHCCRRCRIWKRRLSPLWACSWRWIVAFRLNGTIREF